jgi:hypothetical protein
MNHPGAPSYWPEVGGRGGIAAPAIVNVSPMGVPKYSGSLTPQSATSVHLRGNVRGT